MSVKSTTTKSSTAQHDALVQAMLTAINGDAPQQKNGLRNKLTAVATDAAAFALDTSGAVAGAALSAWENGKTSFKAEVAFRTAQREVRKVEMAEYYAQRLAGKL